MRNFVVVAICLVTCLLLCSFRQASSASQQKPAPQVGSASKQKGENRKEGDSAAPPVPPATDAKGVGAATRNGPREDDRVEVTALPPEIAVKQVKDSIDRTIMWCTVILTMVGALGTYAAVKTLRQVKRQADTLEDHKTKFEQLAKAAEDNAKAAKAYASVVEEQRKLMEAAGRHTEDLAKQAVRQTELTQAQLEMSHRPWIAVEVVPSSPITFDQRGCVFAAKVTMTNVGHSVAKHVSLWTEFAISGLEGPIQVRDRLCNIMRRPENENSDYGWLLFPGQRAVEERPVIARPESIRQALDRLALGWLCRLSVSS
jgi:hypothetical protein